MTGARSATRRSAPLDARAVAPLPDGLLAARGAAFAERPAGRTARCPAADVRFRATDLVLEGRLTTSATITSRGDPCKPRARMDQRFAPGRRNAVRPIASAGSSPTPGGSSNTETAS